MMAADRVIRWTSAAAVIGVAAVAAVASYEHAYHLVRARGAGVDRPSGAADGGRVELRELDGDAGLGSARRAGFGAGEVAARPGIAATLAANVLARHVYAFWYLGSPLARLWWWSCGGCRGGVWSLQRWRRCCWWVAGRWLRGCSRAPLTR